MVVLFDVNHDLDYNFHVCFPWLPSQHPMKQIIEFLLEQDSFTVQVGWKHTLGFKFLDHFLQIRNSN